MKNKKALSNPTNLIVGRRIKIPIAGWYLGSKKKVEWFKGKIIQVGDIRDDGKVRYVLTILWSKKYGRMGRMRMMSLDEQCDEIYDIK
jgi:hypothetical protein